MINISDLFKVNSIAKAPEITMANIKKVKGITLKLI